MRKQVALMLLLILGLIIPNIVSAASTPAGDLEVQKPVTPHDFVLQNPADPPAVESCLDQARIQIDAWSTNARDDLAAILQDYHNQGVLNAAKNRYEICLDVQNGHIPINQKIIIEPNPAADQTKGLAIYDLEVKPRNDLPLGDPVVEVNFPIASVELINLSMTDVIDGLLVTGTQIHITDASITGVAGGGGSCVELNAANNSVIKGSAISNCDVGVLVDGSYDVLVGAATKEYFYEADGVTLKDANTISKNGYGVHVIIGDRILFPYNSFVDNDLFGVNTSHAIVIEPDQNENLQPPEIIPFDGKHAFRCEYDQNGNVTRRISKFSIGNAVVPIYKAGPEMKQPMIYLMTCNTDADGVCDMTGIGGLPIPQNACGVPSDPSDPNYSEEYLVAMQTSNSTSATSSSFFPGGIVIFAETGGVDIPSAPADVESGEEVDIASGAQASAEGGATEIAAMGAKGGCMGGGSSLLPNDISSTYAPHLGAWWIIFSIAFLASMRVAKVHARQRSSGGRRRRK